MSRFRVTVVAGVARQQRQPGAGTLGRPQAGGGLAVTAQLSKDRLAGGQALLRLYAVDHRGQRATVMHTSIGQSSRLIVTWHRGSVVEIECEPQERDITRQILAHEKEIASSGLERNPIVVIADREVVVALGQPISLIKEFDGVDHEHLPVVTLDGDMGDVDDCLTSVDSPDGAPPDDGIPNR